MRTLSKRSGDTIHKWRRGKGGGKVHYSGRQNERQRSRFYIMCGIWKVGRVCGKVLQKRAKGIDFRSYSNKQLHKQGRTKGVYN